MNQPDEGQETDEAAAATNSRSDLQKELAEVRRQRAAISAVLRTIASSPHELQPIFDTILDYAGRLCRAELGSLILFKQNGYCMVARRGLPDPYFAKGEAHLYPVLPDGLTARLIKDRAPIHITDLATDQSYVRRYPGVVALVEGVGVGTLLLVPMLTEDELVGAINIARVGVQPFTDTEIDLTTDFAAQAAIALESTRRERRYRATQMALAHANRVATIGQLNTSIAHELTQPIAAARTSASAGLRWLNKTPPELAEVRDALARIEHATDRAGNVIDRLRALIKKTPPRKEVLDLNEAILEVNALTHSEAIKAGVKVRTQLEPSLPSIHGDRVQLQQVMLNLIANAIQAMSGVAEDRRDLLISSEATEEGARVGVRDSGPGLRPESLPRLFEPFYTTKPDGMGMGLSICRSIIEAHGGRLWATEHTSQGAFFQFTLPARPA